jgi:hypothetical protein
MKHHGFTAREAMGWLRIVRPGSVIGPQQQYLCDKEAVMHRAGGALCRGRGKAPALAAGCGVDSVQRMITETIRHVHLAMSRLSANQVAPLSGSGAAAARELAAQVTGAVERRAAARSRARAVMGGAMGC